MRKRQRKRWTPDEIQQLIAQYPHTPTRVLSQQIGRTDRSVYQKALELGLKKTPEYFETHVAGRLDGLRGGKTRFKPGHEPWNKGKPGTTGNHPNSRRTQFKKGVMAGAAQHNYVPIGSTRISKDGHLEVKVTDDPSLYPARRWAPVHRLVWEAENGPVPDGRIIVFKPGMRTCVREEITADKLECISRAENMRRNTYHRYPKEIALAIQLRGALNRRIRNVEKHR